MARTYGDIGFAEGTWHLKADPHVMIRLKRLFPRVSTFGTIEIKHTDEVAKDLLWILDRYPMRISVEDRKKLADSAQTHDARLAYFDGMLSGKVVPKEFDLAIPLREYQRVAADLALHSRGLLITDDLGLGKSAIGISVLTDPRTRPALIVTLSHLPMQWRDEIKKFAPKLTTHIIKQGTPYPITVKRPKKGQMSLLEPEFPDVLIINYMKLAGWAETLSGIMKYVCFDEIQELRRGDESQKGKAAKHIAQGADFVLGLTATPFYNYGGEIHNVAEVIRPDALGGYSEFCREWCGGQSFGGKASISDPKAFGHYMRDIGLMIRRTRRDVGRELPPLTKIPHHVDHDEAKLEDVAKSMTELAKFFLAKAGSMFDRMKAGGEIDWKLRQATGVAKAPYVADFVKVLCESGEKVLLYGWHHEVYNIWRERLKEYKPVFYTGLESPTQKIASKEAFCTGDSRVLIMSLRAGAGLDGLQHHCRTTVFGELDWSPGVHEQCIGRPFRDGQQDPVTAYFMISNAGSDPIVADVLGIKKGQIDGVMNPDADLFEAPAEAPRDGIRRLAEEVIRRQGIDPASLALDNAKSDDKMLDIEPA